MKTHSASVLDEIRIVLRERSDFLIVGHTNPDGDAVGACFGLALALEKMGKHVQVVLEPYAKKLDIIPGVHLRYTGALNELRVDTLICLDCAGADRLGAFGALLEQASVTICVDHHVTNKGFAQYNFLDSDASSTSELVYRLMHTEVETDKNIASAIYAGMVSDTGGFRYSAASRDTLHAAGQLMTLGIPFTNIYTELLHQHTFTEVKLLGRVLDVCERILDGRVVYACVTRQLMREVNATTQDLDGVVEYLLNIRGVKVSLLLYEKEPPEVKLSLRSHGINIGAIATVLGGGGHMLAAGANINGDIHDIRTRVLALVEQELNSYA